MSAEYVATTDLYTSIGLGAVGTDGTTNTSSAASNYTVSGLPPGLTSNAGSVSGTATAPGTYPVTITATLANGNSSTASVLFVVPNPGGPVVNSDAATSGTVNIAFNYILSSNDPVTAWSADSLPAGLSINTVTGQINGTPTVAGNYNVPVTATGPYGASSVIITMRLDPALYGGVPVITSAADINSQDFPPEGTSSSAFPSPMVNYAVATLNPATSFSASGVPVGMLFNSETGLLSGLPSVPGIYHVSVNATNIAGTVSTTLTLVAGSPRVTARTALAYDGYVGGSFSANTPLYFPGFLSVYATGRGYSSSLDPVIYAATGLPPGLSMSSFTGQITGVPTRAGTYKATIIAANRGGSGDAVATFAITGTPSPVPPVFSASNRAGVAGFLGVPMTYTLAATNVTGYTVSPLPAGLSLNPSTGVISGTPLATGSLSVIINANNFAGTARAILVFNIENAPVPPVITSPCVASMNIGSTFSYNLTVSNFSGLPAPTNYVASGLPSGLEIDPYTGNISGTPSGPAGTYMIPVTALIGPTAAANATLTFAVRTSSSAAPMNSAAGALALLYNPFSYAIRSTNFTPVAGSLPDGLSYDAVGGLVGGFLQSAGTSVVDLKTLANDTAVLTVRALIPSLSLPRLTVQPSGIVAMEGADFTLSAEAVGAPVPTFQWYHNGTEVPGATDAILLLGFATADDTGNYYCVATNMAGSVRSTDAAVVVQTTYAHWQADHFTTQEIAAGLAGDNVSFNGDGVPNLLKYALDLDPRPSLGGTLPVVGSRSTIDGFLKIDFDRNVGVTDINYLVEASSDLHTWTTIAQSLAGAPMVGASGSAGVLETVLVGTSQRHVTVKAAPPTNGPQFLRLRVTKPAELSLNSRS